MPNCVFSESNSGQVLDYMLSERSALKQIPQSKCEPDFPEYQVTLTQTIDRYLNLNCDHKVLYIQSVGDKESTNSNMVQNWPTLLEARFSLTHPIDIGQMEFEDLAISAQRAKNNFATLEEAPPRFKCQIAHQRHVKYDKIIVKNCLKYLEKNVRLFSRFVTDLLNEPFQKSSSNLLIVQRVSDLNSIPFDSITTKQWSLNDVKYVEFMQALQNEYYSLDYAVEAFKITLDSKSDLYYSLNNDLVYPLTQRELLIKRESTKLAEIRELNERLLKYQDVKKHVELTDRLLFISALHLKDRDVEFENKFKLVKNQNKRGNNKSTDSDTTKLDMEIKAIKMEIVSKRKLF